MTVHPASSAGAILLLIRPMGAFHGMIAPTTPTGSRTIRPNAPPPVGVAAAGKQKPAPAGLAHNQADRAAAGGRGGGGKPESRLGRLPFTADRMRVAAEWLFRSLM